MFTYQPEAPNRSGKFIVQVLVTFLPLALMTCGAAYYFYHSTQDRAAIHNRARELVGIELGHSAITNALQEVRRDLRFVSEQHALKNFLDQSAPAEMRDFEQDLLSLATASGLYDQIRWLDETGMERARVNYKNGKPAITPAGELQDKHTRYYFPAAFKVGRGETYISPLDLNIEHERIEIPHKPVLRIATPVFDSRGEKRGIVLLNYLGVEMLALFDKATVETAEHTMLLNQDGYWLKSPKPEEAWGFMFGRDELTLARRHPAAWQRILAADNGQFEDAGGLWTFSTIYPAWDGQKTPERNASAERRSFWKVVAYLPKEALYGGQPLLKPIVAMVAVLLLLQFAGGWKLARLRRLRNEAEALVRHANRNLQRLIEERTAQLQADINLRKQAEEALKQSESKLATILNSVEAYIYIKDTNLHYQYANRHVCKLFGKPLQEVAGQGDEAFFDTATAATLRENDLRVLEHGERIETEEVNTGKESGQTSTYLSIKLPLKDKDGAIYALCGISTDITERKKTEKRMLNLNRVYTVLSNINKAIVRLRDMDTLFHETCRIAVDDGGFRMAWIGLPDAAGRELRPVAHAGLTQDYLDGLHISLSDGDYGRGPTGTAFREARHVCCNNIELDPRMMPWRAAALELGYRGSIAIPLKVKGVVHGVYNLYAGQADFFNEEEIELLSKLTDDIAFAMELAETKAERLRSEAHLRQAAVVFESTREGVMVTDAGLHIRLVNRAFSEITGYMESEVVGEKPAVLSSGRYNRDFYAELWASVDTTGHWQGEIWNRRKNGEVYPELLSISAISDETGQVSGFVGVFADISKLKASEAELEFLAHHDPLTRLPNRLLLLSRLEHGIGLARRENRQLALLILDLDRFKDVNDSFGHLAGDELLQQAAVRLTARLRGVDTVTRLRGDEFTLLLEDITYPEDAGRVADEIIATLSEPWQLANGAEVRIGASIGISLFPQNGNSPAELLQQADAALYQAKAEGRGCSMYFSENMTHSARERIELEARLRRAIAQNELRVFYQPQMDIATGRIIGAEALVRWQDPVEGLISPSRFIPVAEETGLINAVGEWVLNETCLQGCCWFEAGLPPLTLAVNVSPHQFVRCDLVDVVSRTLATTGFPPNRLELELTESALMNRQKEVVDMFKRLRAIGVRLAIDDFGTGYSSLAFLKRFPLDVLKIDKSFVDDIPDSQDDKEIAAAIVVMAHTLRFKVLAEGVETAEQLAFLQGLGCDSYQGYLKSPPLPPDAFAKLLVQSRLE